MPTRGRPRSGDDEETQQMLAPTPLAAPTLSVTTHDHLEVRGTTMIGVH